MIMATVMWREGTRAGLCSDERVPVDEILSANQSDGLQLVASNGKLVDRRARQRSSPDDARLRGRLIEYGGLAAIAIVFALGAWTMAERALARPLQLVGLALSGQS